MKKRIFIDGLELDMETTESLLNQIIRMDNERSIYSYREFKSSIDDSFVFVVFKDNIPFKTIVIMEED